MSVKLFTFYYLIQIARHQLAAREASHSHILVSQSARNTQMRTGLQILAQSNPKRQAMALTQTETRIQGLDTDSKSRLLLVLA